MAGDIFVDTSGFYALLIAKDNQHQAAARVLSRAARKKSRFVTTDYVLDETATLLKARGHTHLLQAFFESVLASAACTVPWSDAGTFSATCAHFLRHHDQAWSFTDCLSFVVMKRFELHDALTKDGHFQQAGFRVLLKE